MVDSLDYESTLIEENTSGEVKARQCQQTQVRVPCASHGFRKYSLFLAPVTQRGRPPRAK